MEFGISNLYGDRRTGTSLFILTSVSVGTVLTMGDLRGYLLRSSFGIFPSVRVVHGQMVAGIPSHSSSRRACYGLVHSSNMLGYMPGAREPYRHNH